MEMRDIDVIRLALDEIRKDAESIYEIENTFSWMDSENGRNGKEKQFDTAISLYKENLRNTRCRPLEILNELDEFRNANDDVTEQDIESRAMFYKHINQK